MENLIFFQLGAKSLVDSVFCHFCYSSNYRLSACRKNELAKWSQGEGIDLSIKVPCVEL